MQRLGEHHDRQNKVNEKAIMLECLWYVSSHWAESRQVYLEVRGDNLLKGQRGWQSLDNLRAL